MLSSNINRALKEIPHLRALSIADICIFFFTKICSTIYFSWYTICLSELYSKPGILQGHVETIFDCKFSPHDGNILATGSFDGTIKLWDITSFTCVSVVVLMLFFCFLLFCFVFFCYHLFCCIFFWVVVVLLGEFVFGRIANLKQFWFMYWQCLLVYCFLAHWFSFE